MKFPYIPEEELRPSYQPGIYSFRVQGAEEKISKGGNEMIKLSLAFDMSGHSPLLINDYLVASEVIACVGKISSFCKSINKEGLYKSQALTPDDIIDCWGKAKLDFEESPDGKKYLRVKYYIVPTESEKERADAEAFNDDIPF